MNKLQDFLLHFGYDCYGTKWYMWLCGIFGHEQEQDYHGDYYCERCGKENL